MCMYVHIHIHMYGLVLFFCFILVFYDTRSHCIALTSLELKEIPYLCLQSIGIKSVGCHTQPDVLSLLEICFVYYFACLLNNLRWGFSM